MSTTNSVRPRAPFARSGSVRANATALPSGEIAGSDSTPASSVICLNDSGAVVYAWPPAKNRPMRNSAAISRIARAASATGRRRAGDGAVATAGALPLDVLERQGRRLPLGRVPHAAEVAAAIAFLASDANRVITGEIIRASGGRG